MVRVVIERQLKEGNKGDLLHLLRVLRTAAMHQPGYVTGESLSDVKDPSIITTISTWRNLEDWKAWEESERRIELYEKIKTLLVKEPRVSIYQVMAAEEK